MKLLSSLILATRVSRHRQTCSKCQPKPKTKKTKKNKYAYNDMVGSATKGYHTWSYHKEPNHAKKCNILMVYVLVHWYRGSNSYLGEHQVKYKLHKALKVTWKMNDTAIRKWSSRRTRCQWTHWTHAWTEQLAMTASSGLTVMAHPSRVEDTPGKGWLHCNWKQQNFN